MPMNNGFGQIQVYVDTSYIREELKALGIDPWFGPTELTRPLHNLRIDGSMLAVRRTIFYDAIDVQAPTADQHEKHLDRLGRLADVLVRLDTITGKQDGRQKGARTKMAQDMVMAARSGFVEYIALASGDANFIPAIQQIQDRGPKVLILAFAKSLPAGLAWEADRIIPLPENPDRSWAIK